MTEEQPIATEHDLDIELHNDRTKHLKKGNDFMKSGTCARSRRQTHNAGLPYMGIHGRIFLVLHFHLLSDADGMSSAELRSLPWRHKRRGLQDTFQHNAQRLRSDGTVCMYEDISFWAELRSLPVGRSSALPRTTCIHGCMIV